MLKKLRLTVIGIFILFIIIPSLPFASWATESYVENYYHLNISGNASGYIQFVRSSSEIWYTGFSVTGDGGGAYSGVEVILSFATHSPPLKFLPPQVGQIWTDTGRSNEYEVDSSAEVISVSENVSVTAGNFNNCAKVDTNLSYPSGYTQGQRYPVKIERWFCPGIGPTKFILTENDGTQHSGQLTSYQNITDGPNDYFPLGLGYTWTFMMNTGRSATWTVDIVTALTDTDGDGIPDDGNSSGNAGDYPCTGGNTVICDDNCLDTPNPDQADTDNDGIGDVCDFTGSISGTVSYSGIKTGNVYVGLYTSPVIAPATRAAHSIILTSPGSYQFTGIPDGTYYAGAIITLNPVDVEIDDPFGMYGIINHGDSPASITINNGNAVTGRDFTLFDGTARQPNPFYSPWNLVAPMNVARDQFTCGVIGGNIYAFGGNGDPNGTNLKSIEMYDPATGIWSFLANNENNYGSGVEELSGAVVNGKFYVFGAWGGGIPYGVFNFVEEYDPSTDTWTSKAPKPTTVSGAPAVAYNGEIYVFGGFYVEDGNPQSRIDFNVVEAYNPSTDTWRFVTNIPNGTSNPAIAVIGDMAYVIGGYDPVQDIMLSDVIVYDFLTNQWITTGFTPPPTPRVFSYAGAAPVVDGKIYLIGGIEGTRSSYWASNVVEIYDTLTNTWSTGDSLPEPTGSHCSVILGSSIYMLGGIIEYGPPNDVRTNAVWILDLADSDNDGILDDGYGDGIPGNNPCTGGNTTNCDDNCVNTPNPDQADIDSDGVGDVCDNCREVSNPDQRDTNSAEDDNLSIAGEQHYGNICDPDFDNDGIVSIFDFNEWRKYAGETVPTCPEDVDLDGDGFCWIQDFNIWRLYYGSPPGPGIGD